MMTLLVGMKSSFRGVRIATCLRSVCSVRASTKNGVNLSIASGLLQEALGLADEAPRFERKRIQTQMNETETFQ
jgi:hypothetical protein